mmetsp:Transcript_702/g.2937  ORF Transcript_702/g.2937 Transcript_702/m.2937 type:complete len:248 (+) Transcript_702:1187-1930(+)
MSTSSSQIFRSEVVRRRFRLNSTPANVAASRRSWESSSACSLVSSASPALLGPTYLPVTPLSRSRVNQSLATAASIPNPAATSADFPAPKALPSSSSSPTSSAARAGDCPRALNFANSHNCQSLRARDSTNSRAPRFPATTSTPRPRAAALAGDSRRIPIAPISQTSRSNRPVFRTINYSTPAIRSNRSILALRPESLASRARSGPSVWSLSPFRRGRARFSSSPRRSTRARGARRIVGVETRDRAR